MHFRLPRELEQGFRIVKVFCIFIYTAFPRYTSTLAVEEQFQLHFLAGGTWQWWLSNIINQKSKIRDPVLWQFWSSYLQMSQSSNVLIISTISHHIKLLWSPHNIMYLQMFQLSNVTMNSHHIKLLCSQQHLVLKGLQLCFQVLNFPAPSTLAFIQISSLSLYCLFVYLFLFLCLKQFLSRVSLFLIHFESLHLFLIGNCYLFLFVSLFLFLFASR